MAWKCVTNLRCPERAEFATFGLADDTTKQRPPILVEDVFLGILVHLKCAADGLFCASDGLQKTAAPARLHFVLPKVTSPDSPAALARIGRLGGTRGGVAPVAM